MKTNVSENLNEVFEVEGEMVFEEELSKAVVIIDESAIDIQIMEDHNEARANLKNIIKQSTEALNSIIGLAQASESARAYEVVGQLTKVLVDANKDLLLLQKRTQDLRKKESGELEQTGDTTNNLFVGSTTDLQKMLKQMREGEDNV